MQFQNKVEYVGRLEFFSTRTSDGIKLSGVVQYPEDTDANNGVFYNSSWLHLM